VVDFFAGRAWQLDPTELQTMLASHEVTVRRAGLLALEQHPPEVALKAVAGMLDDPDVETRCIAVKALGKYGQAAQAHAAQLDQLAADSNRRIQACAKWAVVEIRASVQRPTFSGALMELAESSSRSSPHPEDEDDNNQYDQDLEELEEAEREKTMEAEASSSETDTEPEEEGEPPEKEATPGEEAKPPVEEAPPAMEEAEPGAT